MDDSTRQRVFRYVEASLPRPGQAIIPASTSILLHEFAQQEISPEYLTDPEVLDSLKGSLEEVLQDTREASPPRWNRMKYLAYLMVMAPLHFHKLVFLLKEIARNHWLTKGEAVRVLDVGSGPGIGALSVLFFFELLANIYDMVDIMGEEKRVFVLLTPLDKNEEALDLYQRLVYSYAPVIGHFGYDLGSRLHVNLDETTLVDDVLGQEQYDLILVSHCLSELKEMGTDRKAQLMCDLAKHLSDQGSLLYVESPAQGGIAVANQLKSRVVAKGLGLYGPCSKIHGKPMGPICLTCGLCQKEEIHGVTRVSRLLKKVGGVAWEDLNRENRWVWGIFRRDGSYFGPAMDAHSSGTTPLNELVSKSDDSQETTQRTSVLVQVARKEVEPFLYYKVCDQSSKIEECYLTFDTSIPSCELIPGEVLRLDGVLIDYKKRGDNRTLKNKLYLVVDEQTEVHNVTRGHGITADPSAVEHKTC